MIVFSTDQEIALNVTHPFPLLVLPVMSPFQLSEQKSTRKVNVVAPRVRGVEGLCKLCCENIEFSVKIERMLYQNSASDYLINQGINVPAKNRF